MHDGQQKLTVYHLAPHTGTRTGIASYADLFERAVCKHGSHNVGLIRIGPDEFLARLESLPRGAIVLAQLGVNEGGIYRALVEQRTLRPDLRRIIVVHDPPLLTKAPFELFERLNGSRAMRGLRHFANRALAQRIFSRLLNDGDQFICLTAYGASLLDRAKPGSQQSRKTQVLAHPNYEENFAAQPRARDPEHAIRVGFFGYITHHKRLDLLVSAAAWIKREKGIDAVPSFQVYGDCGNSADQIYREQVLALLASNQLQSRFTFHGFLAEEEIHTRLSSLDLLALPYMTDSGSASGPLAWARTCGVPILANDSPAVRSQLGNSGTGLFVPEPTVESWANLLSSHDLRARLETLRAKSAAAFAESSWESVVKQWVTQCLIPLAARSEG